MRRLREDFLEAKSDEDREVNMPLQTQAMTIYEPRASWFGSQDYELVIVSNADALMSLGFDPTTDELTEGALFASKEVLTSVVK